jgi:hypothetical protein
VAVAIVALAADKYVLSFILLAVTGTPHGEPFIVVYKVLAPPVNVLHLNFELHPHTKVQLLMILIIIII